MFFSYAGIRTKTHTTEYYCLSKGQLISKCFLCLQFLPKNEQKTLRIRTVPLKFEVNTVLCLQQNLMEQTLVVKTNSFVCFLEEFTARQYAFEII